MDFIRTPIIIALLVVSYLLILEWNKEFPDEPSQPVAQQQNEAEELPSDLAGSGFDVKPEAEPELSVPEEFSSASEDISTDTTAPVSDNLREIQVVTDVLSLKIDLSGGNLTYAALNDYSVSLKNQSPLELLVRDSGRYFIAKSGLTGADGFDASKNGPPPLYTASQPSYRLNEGSDELIVDLAYQRDGVKVTKRYTFKRASYEINVDFIIENAGDQNWRGNLFAQLERNQMPDPTSSSGFGAVSYLGAVISTQQEPYDKISFNDMKEEALRFTDTQGWVGFIQHYFVSAWIPTTEVTHTFQLKEKAGRFLMGYVDPAFAVAPGESHSIGTKLYIGPKILEELQKVAPNLDLTIDFGILWLIAKPLFLVLDFIHDYVGNWGVAIILLTVLIKALFFHLSAASYRSMANMRRVTPELTRIRETYGDDRQKMSQAMMELYKKEKINPLGGCLPIIVQMPVFIALYWVLLESVELRQAPFMLWIQDLSIKDPYFVLPLAMGATMFLQMHLNPTPPDPMQAKIMKMMPIVFTIFFLWFPAGLVLYWLVNNCLSIAQQWVITRKIEREAASAT